MLHDGYDPEWRQLCRCLSRPLGEGDSRHRHRARRSESRKHAVPAARRRLADCGLSREWSSDRCAGKPRRCSVVHRREQPVARHCRFFERWRNDVHSAHSSGFRCADGTGRCSAASGQRRARRLAGRIGEHGSGLGAPSLPFGPSGTDRHAGGQFIGSIFRLSARNAHR